MGDRYFHQYFESKNDCANLHIYETVLALSFSLSALSLLLSMTSESERFHGFRNTIRLSIDLLNLTVVTNSSLFSPSTHLDLFGNPIQRLVIVINIDTFVFQLFLESSHDTVCTSIIPDNGVAEGFTGFSGPTKGSFTLVGNS